MGDRVNGWQACLHESAHAVLCEAFGSVVYFVEAREVDGVGFGVTALKYPKVAFHAAVVAAAGQAAVEVLSDVSQPDAQRENVPVRSDDGSLTTASEQPHGLYIAPTAANTVPRLNRSDDDRIAAFCIARVSDAPDVWVERHANVHTEARRLVELHRAAIIEVAHRLWQRVVIGRTEFLEIITPYLPKD